MCISCCIAWSPAAPGARHIMMLVEPAFGCAAPAVPELLAQVLAKLYAAFLPGTELPPEVRTGFDMLGTEHTHFSTKSVYVAHAASFSVGRSKQASGPCWRSGCMKLSRVGTGSLGIQGPLQMMPATYLSSPSSAL